MGSQAELQDTGLLGWELAAHNSSPSKTSK